MKRKLMLAASVVLACVCGCCAQDAGKVASKESSSTTPKATTQYQLELVFTGPWSFVQDSTGKRIIAAAPLITGHSSLYLRSISSLLPPTGLYTLTLTGVKSVPATNPPARFVPDTPPSISPGALTSLETAANDRYVINLPQTQYVQAVYSDPLAYSDSSYPVPAPALSKAYVTKVVFRYSTDSLDVRLDGTQVDVNGVKSPYKPQSLSSEGMIDVSIDDAPDNSICDDGAKGTFKMMNALMQTRLFVDYPTYDVNCQKEDPQNPRGSGGGMRMMNEAAFAAMKSAVLSGLLKLENYTKDLSKDPDSADPSRDILKRLSNIKEGVEGWPKSGPDDAQRRAFATGFNELRGFVIKREKLKESYRNNLVNVIDDVIPFNISGKNCKSPLMLFVNP
jgi:hypothetical protein